MKWLLKLILAAAIIYGSVEVARGLGYGGYATPDCAPQSSYSAPSCGGGS